MSSDSEGYEGKNENRKDDEDSKDKILFNEDRAMEIINVEYLTLTEWLTKEVKKLKTDCYKLIDKTDFEIDPDDEDNDE
jgi:hypothetical protein